MANRLAPFGMDFEAMTIEDLRAALPPGEYEPLTWEAKGTKATREAIRKQVGGFANSREGGILILGADQAPRGGPWTFDGVELSDEPIVWLDQVIRDGLSPVPRYRPRVLWSEGKRAVVGIKVWPVPDPPCITVDGQVFERAPGRTVPVSTAAALARLYGRGDAARARAVKVAGRALRRVMTPPDQDSSTVLVALAVAPTGISDDIASLIFRASWHSNLDATLRPYRMGPRTPARLQFHRSVVDISAFGLGEGVYVSVDTSGGVAVGRTDERATDSRFNLRAEELTSLATLAATIVESTGSYGDSQLEAWARGGTGNAFAARWVEGGSLVDSALIESVTREIKREQGQAEYEPEA